ncbi:MAG: FecR domain-containing protein [Phenylobacterium sp.]|uniref:FecR family protein n=1 Tax=Phenylobacterium sp. TaxID=1871053 RepID=UPI001A45BD94|nr:FecR domain-containing protein [Phenylobacterium sp.]MBL8555385.1 FecR domain-containing protein [Phenylobacterium sp.]
MSAPDKSPNPEAVRDRAAYWHVRLAAEDAIDADWLAFESWLGEHPSHPRAYEAVEQVWGDLDAAPASAATNVARLRSRTGRRAVLWAGGGAVAASLAAAAIAVWPGLEGGTGRTRVIDTAPGERQVVALADGTRITVNGGSHLSATLGRRERRVVMADAEAVFDVAKDPGRPFLIDAGEREIRVVGTEFNVLRQGDDVTVAVRRGVVEVRPTHEVRPVARLTKGQALTHRHGVAADTTARVDPDAALAWTTGRLVFQGQRLDEVARVLSRYPGRRIEVAADAAALPVTATLSIGTQEAMLDSLAAFLPVRVERQPDRVRLSMRR